MSQKPAFEKKHVNLIWRIIVYGLGTGFFFEHTKMDKFNVTYNLENWFSQREGFDK